MALGNFKASAGLEIILFGASQYCQIEKSFS